MVTLGIFARPPIPGQVKTRLIPAIGAIKAAAVYRYCLRHALATALDSELEFRLYLTKDSDDILFNGISCSLQAGADLGERMLLALQDQLSRTASGAIIIGSDCLDICARHLLDAAQALDTHDIVFLPAIDGGYALIGCRRIQSEIFHQVSWGTNQVLEQTMKNATALGYSICLLESVRDIDTLQDLEHYPELLELISTP